MSNLATHTKIHSELEDLDWPSHWRLWIHVSGIRLSPDQKKLIRRAFEQFQSEWSAHGKALKSDMAILYDQVLMIAVDEDHAETTGCSLDKLTHFVGQLETALKTDFLDRSKLYVYDERKGVWCSFGRMELRKAYREREINDDSLVLDTLVDRAEHIEDQLVKSLSASWHAKIV